eukprot:8442964-Pyramimonas_sp.AAC.1
MGPAPQPKPPPQAMGHQLEAHVSQQRGPLILDHQPEVIPLGACARLQLELAVAEGWRRQQRRPHLP